VLECGAGDLSNEGEVFEVYTDPAEVGAVAEALEKMGYTYLSAEAEKVPQNYVELTDEEQLTKFRKMLDVMEDNEDIQNVWHNLENI